MGVAREVAAAMGWSLPYTLGVFGRWKMAAHLPRLRAKFIERQDTQISNLQGQSGPRNVDRRALPRSQPQRRGFGVLAHAAPAGALIRSPSEFRESSPFSSIRSKAREASGEAAPRGPNGLPNDARVRRSLTSE
jgi:hypothetical protein